MSVLFWIWILMMESHALEVIKAHSGGAVLLTSDLQLQLKQDVRWTHPDLLVSLKNNVTACHHGRCQLLRDGSLRFRRVQPGDSGNYSLQVYEEDGTRVLRRDFLLLVESSQSDLSSRSVLVTVFILLFLLFLVLCIIIILFVLNRKRKQRIRLSGPLEDNLYVEMHSHRGNKREEDECHYVPCNPAVSVETPIPAQSSEENVYM
ncbi:uncharacterized protein LOC117490697 isoform X2 [Trematomus bernacchii]|uniref:uncharacterized protein LOC117490697 isoform X2 n=1 Tax=Trematomus bernacchii TaxID=40690 RepID=UPI00146EDFC1|nr:uncharacterized protein LOC117490697 isoform X2 [Trematomus bernacchii]